MKCAMIFIKHINRKLLTILYFFKEKGEEEIDEEKKKEADRLHTQLSDNFR